MNTLWFSSPQVSNKAKEMELMTAIIKVKNIKEYFEDFLRWDISPV